MNILECHDGLKEQFKNKVEEQNELIKEISFLEQYTFVKEYLNKQKELAYLDYKYSKSNFFKRVSNECDHPLYIYDIDLIGLNYAIPCARCLVCGNYFPLDDGISLKDLYDNKRLIAKRKAINGEDYNLTYIDYDIEFNDLRKTYYKLYQISNNGELFNVEDYLFDHLTGNNPHVRRREK